MNMMKRETKSRIFIKCIEKHDCTKKKELHHDGICSRNGKYIYIMIDGSTGRRNAYYKYMIVRIPLIYSSASVHMFPTSHGHWF